MPRSKRPTTRLPPPRESVVLKGCVQAAKTLGIELRRRNVGAHKAGGRFIRFGTRGEADLTGTLNDGSGRRVEVEVKRPGNKPTPLQLAWLESVRALGGVAFWTDDPAKCLEALRHILNGGRVTIDGRPETG